MDSYIAGVDSIEVQLTVKDKDTGVAIDLTTVYDVEVEILLEDDADAVVYWDGSLLGGEVEHGDDTGEIILRIDPEDTVDWPTESAYVAHVLKSVVDADFTAGYKKPHGKVHIFNLG